MTGEEINGEVAAEVFDYHQFMDDTVCEVAQLYGTDDYAIVFVDYGREDFPGVVLTTLDHVRSWMQDQIAYVLDDKGRERWAARWQS